MSPTEEAKTASITETLVEPVDPPFTKILVGVDGRSPGGAAVLQGARLAALVGADVDLLHVVEQTLPGPEEAVEAPRTVSEILRGAVRLVEPDGVRATAHAVVGRAPAMLEHEARERWADLVCIGAGTARSLATVATLALRRAHCSVLIARSATRRFPERILCAVDGSEGADEAVRQAAGIASRAEGASLRLLHVAEEGNGDGRWMARGDGALRRAGEIADRWGVDPTAEMAVGTPAETIAGIAEVWGSDLVVVGSRGLRGVSRWLLGSVSEAVASTAPSSVLVARHRPW